MEQERHCLRGIPLVEGRVRGLCEPAYFRNVLCAESEAQCPEVLFQILCRRCQTFLSTTKRSVSSIP